jgi:thiol-disulfide isomerase/thioredoxin
MAPQRTGLAGGLSGEGKMPVFGDATPWLNTRPVATKTPVRGHVVLVNFWTSTCINCRRFLPYAREQGPTHAPLLFWKRYLHPLPPVHAASLHEQAPATFAKHQACASSLSYGITSSIATLSSAWQ